MGQGEAKNMGSYLEEALKKGRQRPGTPSEGHSKDLQIEGFETRTFPPVGSRREGVGSVGHGRHIEGSRWRGEGAGFQTEGVSPQRA